jgi:hypothetical protein
MRINNKAQKWTTKNNDKTNCRRGTSKRRKSKREKKLIKQYEEWKKIKVGRVESREKNKDD